MSTEKFGEWCILELMGHRRLGGYVTEQEIGGASFIRIDVPGEEGNVATQFYNPSAVYCMTPTTEKVATDFAKNEKPRPVTKWDLEDRSLPAPAGALGEDIRSGTPKKRGFLSVWMSAFELGMAFQEQRLRKGK